MILLITFLLLVFRITCECDTFIDCDPYDAFNGWKVGNSEFVGHYPSSVSLPSSISRIISKGDLENRKFVSSTSKLCLYGHDSKQVKDDLIDRDIVGKEGIEIIESLPIPKVSPYSDRLISAEWLHDQTMKEKVLIFHVSEGPLQPTYDEFVNGSVNFSSDLFETYPIFNIHPCSKMYPVFMDYGIQSTSKIVIYGGEGSDTGIPILGATRFLMALMKCGVKDVRILNGGVQSWKQLGYPIISEPLNPTPVSSFGEKSEVEVFVTEETIQQYVNGTLGTCEKSNNFYLLDDRTIEEFEGLITGYPFVKKKGRIPKSMFLGQDFLALDNGSVRPYVEIERMLKNLGISQKNDDELVFYCGTGWRASVMWFIAKFMIGFQNCYVYDGGWNEWQRNPDNPIVS